MKKRLSKILSFSLALIVFFTSLSFTISMNYCNDSLVDFSFFKQADNCAQVDNDVFIHECKISKVPCCNSKQLVVKSQDNVVKTTFENLTHDQQLFLAAFTYSYITLFEGYHKNVVAFAAYTPPLLVRDVLVLDQTFLI